MKTLRSLALFALLFAGTVAVAADGAPSTNAGTVY